MPRPRKSKSVGPRRLIRKPEVRHLTGYSDTSIWREEKAGRFPKRVQLILMAVAWYLDEIEDWIKARIRQAGKPPSVQYRGRPAPRKADELDPPAALKPHLG